MLEATYQVRIAGVLPPEMLERVIAEFPSWSPEQGLCNRCLEAYAALTHA